MFVSIYGRDQEHIANVEINKYTITKKVFDLDVSNFEGHSDVDISDGLLFVFKDNSGKQIYSGFMKNIVYDEKTGYVSFKGKDFKKIYDTEVLLDFTQVSDYDYTINGLFYKVSSAVNSQATSIIPVQTSYPTDGTSTTDIAVFDGSYFVVNAMAFLKTYLAYYNYRIVAIYREQTKDIYISYVLNDDTKEIKLNDFAFEKSTTDTKVNHTVARVKFDSDLQNTKTWVNITETEYNALDAGLQGVVSGADSPNDFGLATDLIEGQGVKITNSVGDTNNWYIVALAKNIWVESSLAYYIWADRVDINENDKTPSTPGITKPNVNADDYEFGVCVKINYPTDADLYFKLYPNSAVLPSAIAEKEYFLGTDNVIYEGSITDTLRIFPVITKIFQDEYLAKAQFNAIWELVNGRYNENIEIVYTPKSPLDIRELDLYTMITVYDKNGVSKVLPVSEIEFTQDDYRIKLGFKKTKFTDIVKEATGTTSSGSVSKPIAITKKIIGGKFNKTEDDFRLKVIK